MGTKISVSGRLPQPPKGNARTACSAMDAEKLGGLKGSMQDWLEVYPREFEIPTFLVVSDELIRQGFGM